MDGHHPHVRHLSNLRLPLFPDLVLYVCFRLSGDGVCNYRMVLQDELLGCEREGSTRPTVAVGTLREYVRLGRKHFLDGRYASL